MSASDITNEHILMIHIGRSGSSVLGDLLTQHAKIHWDGEIFEMDNEKWNGKSDPLETLQARMRATNKRHYGLEFKFFHAGLIGLSLEDAIKQFKQNGFNRFIVLKRENYLRKIVSSRIAQETGRWFIRSGTEPTLTRIHLDLDNLLMDKQVGPLLSFLQAYDRDFERIETLLAGQQILHLSYEADIEQTLDTAYRKVCNFLNLPTTPARLYRARTTPFKLSEIIENYNALSAALENTPYAWMLKG